MNIELAWLIAKDSIAYYECPICDKKVKYTDSFADIDDLAEHLKNEHTDKQGKEFI